VREVTLLERCLVVQIKRLVPDGRCLKRAKPAVFFAPDFCNA
jgi:hypothetical protein